MNADNVVELDALFDRLDKDGGGSLDLPEVKAAMKVMQQQSVEVERAMELATQREEHWRARAAKITDCAVTMEELAAAEEKLLEVQSAAPKGPCVEHK